MLLRHYFFFQIDSHADIRHFRHFRHEAYKYTPGAAAFAAYCRFDFRCHCRRFAMFAIDAYASLPCLLLPRCYSLLLLMPLRRYAAIFAAVADAYFFAAISLR